jgi:RNA polymerase sigma-70 factor (ECF subfamily)
LHWPARQFGSTLTAERVRDEEVAGRADLGRAWRLLSDRHREALALSVWDGLTSQQAATILGISPVAYRLRLSRARAALDVHLGEQPPPGPRSLLSPQTAASEAQS